MLLLLLVLFVSTSSCFFTDSESSIALEAESFDLPPLYHICTYSFTSPYTKFNFDPSNSLYLSSRSKDLLSPDIIYQTSTSKRDITELEWDDSLQQYTKRASSNTFGSAITNSDIALFTDFGETPITNITYHSATTSTNIYLSSMPIQSNHTYGLVISKPDVQAYILISIENYIENSNLDILYSVLYYRVRNGLSHAESPDFDGNRQSSIEIDGCDLRKVLVPYNKIEKGIEIVVVILSSVVGGLGLTLTIIIVIALYCCCKRKRCCCFL